MPNDVSPAAPAAGPPASDAQAASPAEVGNGLLGEPVSGSAVSVPDQGSPAGPAAGDAATPSTVEPVRVGPVPQVAKGLSYAVDIVFCIDVTGSMTPILDAVKANALRFYDDVQANLTEKGKNVDELRVRIIAFRDFAADPESALQESSFFLPPGRAHDFQRVRGRPGPGRWR